MITDNNAGVCRNYRTHCRAEISNFDFAARPQVEERPVIDPAVTPDSHAAGLSTAVMKEGEGAIQPASLTDDNVERQRLWKPVVGQESGLDHGFSPTATTR